MIRWALIPRRSTGELVLDNKEDKMTKEEDYGEGMRENDDTISTSPTAPTRENILSLMDSFIEQITSIRKTLLGVSISALILAPFCYRAFSIFDITSIILCYS